MNDTIQNPLVQGLQATYDAYEKGAQTAADLLQAATDERLKANLAQGAETGQEQKQQLLQVFEPSALSLTSGRIRRSIR